MKIIAYPRKSSESEDRQVLSIQAQVAELQALADRRGERIDVVLDESRSAREPGRPIFSKLLKMIERGEVATLYAWRLDRLARNPVDGAYLIHHLGHGRIRQIVTPEGVFTGTGNDKLLMQLHFGMATKYVDDLSENVKRGNREVLKSGRVPGQVPIGYLKVPANGTGARETGIDPLRFPIVQQLWRMLLTGGYTVNELARRAAVMGLTGRVGGRPLQYNAVLQIFHNPFYCGRIVRGGQTCQGNHTPMITASEFERAQGRINRDGARRPVRLLFAYSGFVRCGSCGKLAVAEEHRKRGRRYVYYACSNRSKSLGPRCAEPFLAERAVDEAVQAVIARLDARREFLRWAIDDVERQAADRRDCIAASAASLKETLITRETELSRLTDLVVRGVLREREYLSHREAVEKEIAGIRATLADPQKDVDAWVQQHREALGLAVTIGEAFRGGDQTVRREIIGRLVERIVAKSRSAEIVLAPPFSMFASADSTPALTLDRALRTPE